MSALNDRDFLPRGPQTMRQRAEVKVQILQTFQALKGECIQAHFEERPLNQGIGILLHDFMILGTTRFVIGHYDLDGYNWVMAFLVENGFTDHAWYLEEFEIKLYRRQFNHDCNKLYTIPREEVEAVLPRAVE